MSQGNLQFVKNDDKPEETSELWTIAEGWKISKDSGKVYTNLSKVFRDDKDPESEDNYFYNALNDQLDGKVTEPIDYIGFYFVAGATREGVELVYSFEKHEIDAAKRQVRYSHKPRQSSNTNQSSQNSMTNTPPQQNKPKFSRPGNVQATITNNTSMPIPQTLSSKPTILKKTIEVVFDHILIAWNDFEAKKLAIEDGLIPIPVVYCGANNWGVEDKKNEDIQSHWYGRIKLVEIN